MALLCSDGLDRSSCSDEENAVIDEVAAIECDADGGGSPPACIAEQWEGVESAKEAGALLCGGLLNRGTCSDDENAVIDEATASMCGGGGDGDCRSLHCPALSFRFCD